jgi:hypothetical protein
MVSGGPQINHPLQSPWADPSSTMSRHDDRHSLDAQFIRLRQRHLRGDPRRGMAMCKSVSSRMRYQLQPHIITRGLDPPAAGAIAALFATRRSTACAATEVLTSCGDRGPDYEQRWSGSQPDVRNSEVSHEPTVLDVRNSEVVASRQVTVCTQTASGVQRHHGAPAGSEILSACVLPPP